MKIVSIQSLDKLQIEKFSSNCEPLDVYFHQYALKNDIDNRSKTFAYVDDTDVVRGYVTLCNSEVDFKDIPQEYKNNGPKYPFPAVKIARLAVAYNYRNKGVGKSLLKEAMNKTILVSISSGVLLLTVDAKQESASFYQHFGFVRILGFENKYFITVKTLIKALVANK